MSDLFSRLARRTRDTCRTVRPVTAPVFAPASDTPVAGKVPVPVRQPVAAPTGPLSERSRPLMPTALPENPPAASVKATPVPESARPAVAAPPQRPERPDRPVRADDAAIARAELEPAAARPLEPPTPIDAGRVTTPAAPPSPAVPAVAPTERRMPALEALSTRLVERTKIERVVPGRQRRTEPAPLPVIEVTIGRIEVRTPSPSTPRKRPARQPTLTLEAYAAERKAGRR